MEEQVLLLFMTKFGRVIALIHAGFGRPYYMCGGFSLEVSGLCIFQFELPKDHVFKLIK